MNLVFVIWSAPFFGGMERRYTRLADSIANSNKEHDVFIFVQRRCAETVYDFLPEKTKLKVVEFGRKEYKRGFFGLMLELLSFRRKLANALPNNVHVVANPGALATILSYLSPLKSSISLSMVDSTYEKNSTRVKRVIAYFGLLRCKRVDCLSQETFEKFNYYFGDRQAAKARVAPCSFSDYSSTDLRGGPRDIDVVCMARFVEDKGYDLIEKIEPYLNDFNVHLCGFGPRRFGFDGTRFNIYQTKDPLSVLSRGKIFLSIQRGTNYPSQAALEAMYCGCAIIATDVGETRKLLDESCAVMIPYNAESLKKAIKMLMADPALRNRLGRKAKQRALGFHTVERYRDYFMEKVVGNDNPYHNRLK